MSKKRKQYSNEFKAKVALAAIREKPYPSWQHVTICINPNQQLEAAID